MVVCFFLGCISNPNQLKQMARNNGGNRRTKNDQVSTADAKFLQTRLYNACHSALNQAEESGQTSPALLQAVHRIVQDSGVRVQVLDEQVGESLFSLVDRIQSEEGFSFLETR